MAKSKPSVARSYLLVHKANAAKINKITSVLTEFQMACKTVQAQQMRVFVQDGEKFWNRRGLQPFQTRLSERYKRSVQNQVVMGLSSWLELSKTAIRSIIAKSSLPSEVKADLWWLNRSGAHYAKEATLPAWEYLPNGTRLATPERRAAPQETLDLLRAIMKHVRKHQVNVPKLWQSRTMMLDGTVAQVERSKTTEHDLWVRVSTLEKGSPVWVPLKTNRFFNEAAGELSNFAQVSILDDSSIKVRLVKKSVPALAKLDGIDISLDWGLRSTFATEFGDQLGRSLYPWLRQIDKQLTSLTSELQRKRIPLKSNGRYQRFQQRIRDYVKNEINRIINRLLRIYDIKSITVESLDFRNGGLSRRMNRILSRAGRAAIQSKLASIAETRGVTTHKVNPAYTSQQCSGCGYTAKNNRNNLHFKCRFCGKRLNADTSGSRTIAMRRSHGHVDLYVSRQAILQRLDGEFENRWGLSFSDVKEAHCRTKERRGKTLRPTTDGLACAPSAQQTGLMDELP